MALLSSQFLPVLGEGEMGMMCFWLCSLCYRILESCGPASNHLIVWVKGYWCWFWWISWNIHFGSFHEPCWNVQLIIWLCKLGWIAIGYLLSIWSNPLHWVIHSKYMREIVSLYLTIENSKILNWGIGPFFLK